MAVESPGGTCLTLEQCLKEQALQQGLVLPTTYSCWRTRLEMVRHTGTPASAHILTAAALPQVLQFVLTNTYLTS